LTTDLMLLDRCLSELRRIDPRARHLQAKVVAQIEEGDGARRRFEAIEKFLTAYIADADVHLVSCHAHRGAEQRLRFRPAMGRLRSEAAPRSL
jgi:acid stress-induced BolA-like protein IbaG/YrbA